MKFIDTITHKMPATLTQLVRRPETLWRAPLALFAAEAGPTERFVATGLCLFFAICAGLAGAFDAVLLKWLLVALSMVCGGLRATIGALAALRAHQPDINFLMVLAAVVTIPIGHWYDGVILLILFSLSDALERYAIARTRRGIKALVALRPTTAAILRNDRELTVPVEELRVGDLVRVRPGERFPIDGRVFDGHSSVDESIVTGESMPVSKSPGSGIYAGTINASGSLIVQVTRPTQESTIERIVRLVEEAQERKAPVQRLIEQWQTPYVLGVLGISLLTLVMTLIVSQSASTAIYRAMTVLVAASPCAVVLASPVAVLATVTRGARRGVLFKGGSHLERLAGAASVAVDKTGTLTHGKPEVTAVEPFGGADESTALSLAAALEHLSEHPLAKAVLRAAAKRDLDPPDVVGFSSEAGLGVHGMIDGKWVGVGRPDLFARHAAPLPPAALARLNDAEGQTRVIVMRSDGAGGVLTFADTVRPEAAHTLEQIRQLGIRRIVMLTGDHAAPAQRVAAAVGITDVKAGLRPEEKLGEIRSLAKDDGGVVMVGDGVNDAPALAAASVGVAMGAAGADVALETADVVLMREDLSGLAEAIHLAQRCRRVIAQSLGLAMGMIVMLVLLTLGGWMILPLAVVGHEGSTVLVMLNGLRLLRQDSAAEHLAKCGRHGGT